MYQYSFISYVDHHQLYDHVFYGMRVKLLLNISRFYLTASKPTLVTLTSTICLIQSMNTKQQSQQSPSNCRHFGRSCPSGGYLHYTSSKDPFWLCRSITLPRGSHRDTGPHPQASNHHTVSRSNSSAVLQPRQLFNAWATTQLLRRSYSEIGQVLLTVPFYESCSFHQMYAWY